VKRLLYRNDDTVAIIEYVFRHDVLDLKNMIGLYIAPAGALL